MALTPADFEFIARLVRERSAIVLETGKEYLVESRLLPLARQEGFDSIASLVTALRTQSYGPLQRKTIEAMTTNETSFFRDLHPFEALKKNVLPQLIEKRASERKLTIWCAASSSGQEPYTIALTLREHFPALATWNVQIIATDISTYMLERTREGRYSQIEVNRGLPIMLLTKYFLKQGLEWQVRDEVRRLIKPMELNLAGAWPALPAMDIIFVRNVLIYFDLPTKKGILDKMQRLLRPDGFLFLGGAETTINITDAFERVQLDRASCYRVRTTTEGQYATNRK